MIPSFPVSREVSYPTEKYPTIELSDYEHLLRLGVDPRAKIDKKDLNESKESDEINQTSPKLSAEKEGHAKVSDKKAPEKNKKSPARSDKTAVARVQKKS